MEREGVGAQERTQSGSDPYCESEPEEPQACKSQHRSTELRC